MHLINGNEHKTKTNTIGYRGQKWPLFWPPIRQNAHLSDGPLCQKQTPILRIRGINQLSDRKGFWTNGIAPLEHHVLTWRSTDQASEFDDLGGRRMCCRERHFRERQWFLSNVIRGHLGALQACMPCGPACYLFKLPLFGLEYEKHLRTNQSNEEEVEVRRRRRVSSSYMHIPTV